MTNQDNPEISDLTLVPVNGETTLGNHAADGVYDGGFSFLAPKDSGETSFRSTATRGDFQSFTCGR